MNNLQSVLEIAKPKIDEMLSKFVANQLKKNKHFRPFDAEMYELGITIDLMKAFGKYVKPTDVVSNVRIDTSKGVIIIDCDVTRDGYTHILTTEMIYAGGYNIQCLHYRYISHTDLRSNENNTAADALIAKRVKLTKTEQINQSIECEMSRYNRLMSEFNALKVMTVGQVIARSYLAPYLKIKYIDLSETGQRNYETAEKYDAEMNKQKEEVLTYHANSVCEKRLKCINKEHEKNMTKLQNKLNSL